MRRAGASRRHERRHERRIWRSRPLVAGALVFGVAPLLAASDPGLGLGRSDRAPSATVDGVGAERWVDGRLDLNRLRRGGVRAPATVGLPPAAGTAAGSSGAAPAAGTIPPVALAAYRSAAAASNRTDARCHLPWFLLAAIGRVESGHAASGGSGRPGWDGTARPAILGPVLDGTGGFGAIRDSDGGALDGDRRWDRAVGPMQFLPSSWRRYAADGNGDGRSDPQNVADAALAAARYLCAGGGDLRTPEGAAAAVYSYNHSLSYVRLVLELAASYAGTGSGLAGIALPAVRPVAPSIVADVPRIALPLSPRPVPPPAAAAPRPQAAGSGSTTPHPAPAAVRPPVAPTPSPPPSRPAAPPALAAPPAPTVPASPSPSQPPATPPVAAAPQHPAAPGTGPTASASPSQPATPPPTTPSTPPTSTPGTPAPPTETPTPTPTKPTPTPTPTTPKPTPTSSTPPPAPPTATPTPTPTTPKPTPPTATPKPMPPTATPTPTPTTPKPTPPTATPKPTPPSPTPTPAPTPPRATEPVLRLRPGGPAHALVAVGSSAGLPTPPPPGRVGWWRAGTRPGGTGTVVLVAAAGGPLDPARLPLHRAVTVRTAAGTVTFRVVAHQTRATLPALGPAGSARLLLVSYSRGPGGPSRVEVVRAVPVAGG